MCGVVAAFAGVPMMLMAGMANNNATATVRSVIGRATYTEDGGQATPLRPNTVLNPGAIITTEADTTVDLQVNGRTSTVRVTANTTMTLEKMLNLGAGDSETMLNLKNGTVVGSVRKISKASKYEVMTARGVAGIRGTDFAVSSLPNPNGAPTVTFSSVTGTVYCVANILVNNVMTQVPKTLNTGQSWTPPETATSVIDPAVVATTVTPTALVIIVPPPPVAAPPPPPPPAPPPTATAGAD